MRDKADASSDAWLGQQELPDAIEEAQVQAWMPALPIPVPLDTSEPPLHLPLP